jgi:hypothetical protein
MPHHTRQVALRRRWAKPPEKAILRTFTVLIPRSYNPDVRGVRKPVELSKLIRTFREIRQLSPGYSLQCTDGWCRDRDTGKGIRDHHFRFDIDMIVTPSVIANLCAWKRILELRFEQQSIYMRLSKEIVWL